MPKRARKGLDNLRPWVSNARIDRILACARYQPMYRNQFWVSPLAPHELPDVLLAVPDADCMLFEPCRLAASGFSRGPLGRMAMYLDFALMLQDMYLVKVDRASMSASLEVRSPFLDTAVIELSGRMPFSNMVRGGQTKYLLKKLAGTMLPDQIVYRPKKGFGIPLAAWMKRLVPMIMNLVDNLEQDVLNADYIKKLSREHVLGQRDHASRLWGIYVFLNWLKKRY